MDGFTRAEGDTVIIVDLFKCCLNAVYIFGHNEDVGHVEMGEPQSDHMTSSRLQPQRLKGRHCLECLVQQIVNLVEHLGSRVVKFDRAPRVERVNFVIK